VHLALRLLSDRFAVKTIYFEIYSLNAFRSLRDAVSFVRYWPRENGIHRAADEPSRPFHFAGHPRLSVRFGTAIYFRRIFEN